MSRKRKTFFFAVLWSFLAVFLETLSASNITTLEEKGTFLSTDYRTSGFTKGYKSKNVTSFSVAHHAQKLGGQLNVAYVKGDEKASFVSGGFSFGINDLTSAKFLVGGSSKNRGILPRQSFSFSVESHCFDRSLMVIPLIEHREYRNGVKEYLTAIDFVYYFKPFQESEGYMGAQFHLKNASPRLAQLKSRGMGVGVTYIQPNAYAAELYTEFGRTFYENSQVNQRNYPYFLIRPMVDLPFNENVVFLMGASYEKTKFYNVREYNVGLKIVLPGGP